MSDITYPMYNETCFHIPPVMDSFSLERSFVSEWHPLYKNCLRTERISLYDVFEPEKNKNKKHAGVIS